MSAFVAGNPQSIMSYGAGSIKKQLSKNNNRALSGLESALFCSFL